MPEQNFTTLSVPKVLADKIKRKIQGTSFHSASSYATYVLRQVIANSEQEDTGKKQEVKEKLKILGYI